MNFNLGPARIVTRVLPLLAVLAVPAQASLITQTQNFSANNTGNNFSMVRNTAPLASNSTVSSGLSFDRFDNGVGGAYFGYQLEGVKITYNTDIRHTAAVIANDRSSDSIFECLFGLLCSSGYVDSASVTGAFNSLFTLTLTDPASQAVLAQNMASLGCTNASGGAQNCQSLYDSGTLDFSGAMDLSSFSLADFKGTSPVQFALDTFLGFTGSCTVIRSSPGGNENQCDVSNNGFWQGSVTVEYEAYDVPAPATLGLLGLALAGLGCSRRKKA